MNITFEKNEEKINSLKRWQELGHPTSERHWKSGRSSKELARYAIERPKDFEALIKKVLKECALPEQDFICEPEASASLGKGMKQGGCRKHDLLMRGSKGCMIGIEAKVSESFGQQMKDALRKQSQKKSGNEEDTRAYQLLDFFVASSRQIEKARSVGYQLFAATRGTIQSALSNSFSRSIVLVLVFTGKVHKEPSYEKHCQKNDEDFDAFVKAINADKNGKIVRKIDENEVECWVKKVKVTLS